jgi:hypothetical protein
MTHYDTFIIDEYQLLLIVSTAIRPPHSVKQGGSVQCDLNHFLEARYRNLTLTSHHLLITEKAVMTVGFATDDPGQNQIFRSYPGVLNVSTAG